MKKFLLSTLILSTASCVPQPCLAEWDAVDKGMAVVGATAHIIDWGQTRNIAKDPLNYTEINGILPKHPTVGQVDAYMILTGAMWLGAAALVPDDFRKPVLGLWILSRYVIINNHQIGLRFSKGF